MIALFVQRDAVQQMNEPSLNFGKCVLSINSYVLWSSSAAAFNVEKVAPNDPMK